MGKKYLSEKQLSAFCGSLAMMLRSGVPVQEAVELFADENTAAYSDDDGVFSAYLRSVAERMNEMLVRGEGFTAAAEATGAFPQYTIGVLRTAEMSGRMDEAMEHLASYYDGRSRLFERLRSAVIYPVALMLLMCIVLAVLVFAVLPMFMRVYGSITGSLSASSFAYVPAANAIGWTSLVLSGIIGIVLLALALALRTAEGREKLGRPLRRFALTRHAVRTLAVSQLTGTVATLLASGASEINAIDFCLEQQSNEELAALLRDCRGDMEQGVGFSRALMQRKVLPALCAQILLSGEESGRLPQAMETVSRQLGQEAENAMCAIVDSVEPVLIGYLTLTVGFTLLSVMLPLLGILSGI